MVVFFKNRHAVSQYGIVWRKMWALIITGGLRYLSQHLLADKVSELMEQSSPEGVSYSVSGVAKIILGIA